MKKVYNSPKTMVTTIGLTQMIAGSETIKMNSSTNYNGSTTIEAKERDEDHESTTWSDGGLW